MALFIDGLSCEVAPRQNPGERTGICTEGYRFIYMTGSGAWSRLLEPGTVQALIGEAESRIPVGYNQLWIFEKKFCATPDPGEARPCQRLDEERKQYPQELGRHLWPGQLYVILQDPEWAQRGPIPLTYHTQLDEAIVYAQLQADQLKVRTIVGLMLADVTWH